MILSSLGKKRRPPQKRLSGADGANSFRKPLFVKKNAFFADSYGTAYGKDCNRGMAVRNLNKQKSCGTATAPQAQICPQKMQNAV